MMPEAMQILITRYFAATRTMDVEACLACFADDAVSYDPYGAPPIQGKDTLRAFFLSVTTSFREIGFTEDFLAVTGNRAIFHWTSHDHRLAHGVSRSSKYAVWSEI